MDNSEALLAACRRMESGELTPEDIRILKPIVLKTALGPQVTDEEGAVSFYKVPGDCYQIGSLIVPALKGLDHIWEILRDSQRADWPAITAAPRQERHSPASNRPAFDFDEVMDPQYVRELKEAIAQLEARQADGVITEAEETDLAFCQTELRRNTYKAKRRSFNVSRDRNKRNTYYAVRHAIKYALGSLIEKADPVAQSDVIEIAGHLNDSGNLAIGFDSRYLGDWKWRLM